MGPPVMPADKSSYEREMQRGARIFGATRRTEYDLLREAAEGVMAAYR